MSKSIEQIISTARQYNLAGVEILDQFSRLDIATIYNGIGPDRFPDWLREIVTEANGLFEPAALIHDIEYHIGGTRENFTAANDRFRENCYTLVNAAYGWYDPRRYKWLFRAWRYAGYCQEFGWSGFHKSGEGREPVGRELVDLVDGVDEVDDVDGAESEVMADCRGGNAECKVMADCRGENAGPGAETREAGKCAGCENCTCGKHETEVEPAAKPKSHKKTRKGKKK